MKANWAKKLLSVALAGSMIASTAIPTCAWTTSNAVSEREENSAAISLEAAGEGMVLMENNGALPLAKGSEVVVYGSGAYATIKGGTGSGDVNQRNVVNILDGLQEVYTINNLKDYWQPRIEDRTNYEAGKSDTLTYWNAVRSWFSINYSMKESVDDVSDAQFRSQSVDTAIYVVSRVSGEGSDRADVHEGDGDYYLSEAEDGIITELTKYYKNVIIVINSANVMDTSYIEKLNSENAGAIDAVVMMSQGGMYGGTALASLLDGDTNPSGKLVDTWPKDYMDFPSSATLSENRGDNGVVYDEYYYDDIYVGYRYFDTFNVTPAYEFGYGLSYTTFKQEITGFSADENTVSVTVQVTNTGDVAGKEVEQVYFSAPDGALDKPYQELVTYGKTDLLQPGEAQVMTLTYNTDEMSSYSEELAAYLLEDGDYVVRVGNSSRNTHVAGVVSLDKDAITEQLSNQLTVEEDKADKLEAGKVKQDETTVSYSYEGEAEEIAAAPVAAIQSAEIKTVNNASTEDDEHVTTYYSSNDADTDSAKYAAKGGWTADNAFPETLVPVETSNQTTLLDVYEGNVTMEQFVAGLSVNQLSYIVNGVDVGTLSSEDTAIRASSHTASTVGTWEYPDCDTYKYTDAEGNETRTGGNTLGYVANYTAGTVWASTPNYYNTLLIPSTDLSDGPAGARITKTGQKNLYTTIQHVDVEQNEDGSYYVANEAKVDCTYGTYYQYATAFPVGVTLAQTWNTELLYRVGQCYGDEYVEFDMTYILGPGMNIHRTPLCGRNFEYYSEDPVIVGYTSGAFTNGMESKDGIGTTVKHFAGNNNESYRNWVNDVVSERAFREIYLKGFEICIKSAQPMAIMTSYNLVNGVRTVNSHDLCTDIAREEWGFEGAIESDYGAANRADADEEHGLTMWANILHSGNDWIMGGSSQSIGAPATTNESESFATSLAINTDETPSMGLGDLQRSAANILKSVMYSNMFGDKMADYVDTSIVTAEEIARLQNVHNGSYNAHWNLKTYQMNTAGRVMSADTVTKLEAAKELEAAKAELAELKASADATAAELAAAKAEVAELQAKYNLVRKTVKITSLKAGKKKVTVKVSSISGAKYEIKYATSKSFKSAKTKVTSKITKVITGLKSKKTYYVKARAYKMIGGVKVATKYSAVKKVKVK